MSVVQNSVATARRRNTYTFEIRYEDQGNLHILERVHEFDESSDGKAEFSCTVIVFEVLHQIYTARVPKMLSLEGAINLVGVVGVPVNMEYVFPALEADFHVGSEPVPSNIYRKTPTLAYYSSLKCHEYHKEGSVEALLVLREVRNMETLSRSPHSNIVKYYGCNVLGGRIVGFFLEKLEQNLYERMENRKEPLDVEKVMKCVRSAVAHIHKLGLCHNDINPSNVMFRKDGCPVVVDFDSCLPIGERLTLKAGTEGWYDPNQTMSTVQRDLAAIDELEEYLQDETSEESSPC